MNINEYKKYLKSVHNTLDDPSMNNQLRDRLSESPVCDMKEYKPDATKYKSSHEPTTASGDSLRPNSKTAEKMEKLKEEEEVEISECVVEYFENYFGDNLNEDTSDEDIMGAVYDLIDLVEVVYNEAHTLLPDNPDVVKWWGGREKFDKLNARLGNKRKIPKVEVTRKPLKKKKKKGQLELFNAANQYFEEYFGQELNENISQNDIMDAVEDLVYLCEAVCDAVGLDEAFPRKVSTHPQGRYGSMIRHGDLNVRISKKHGGFADKSGYLKPSPEQLRTAIAQRADNSPLVVAGQGANQKVVTPSMVRDKARDKRIEKMKKFKMR